MLFSLNGLSQRGESSLSVELGRFIEKKMRRTLARKLLPQRKLARQASSLLSMQNDDITMIPVLKLEMSLNLTSFIYFASFNHDRTTEEEKIEKRCKSDETP